MDSVSPAGLLTNSSYSVGEAKKPMSEVTIRSADPVQMYWRMVFYGAADAENELIITSKDEETGIFTVSLKTD